MSEQIISKRCSKCNQTKQLSEFHKARLGKYGHRSICKSCCKVYYRNTNYATQKRYKKSPKGKVAERKYQRSQKRKVVKKRYDNTDKGKAAQNRYKAIKPNRIKARSAVNVAIKDSKLPKPDILLCHYYLQNPDCEKQAKQYHHWHGYEKEHWLDVVPACKSCHSSQH